MHQIEATLKSLTQSQFSIWLGQKFSPNTPLYNVPYAFHINGKVDKDKFSKAFTVLIDGTDVLRTIFVEKDNIPYQKVLDTYNYKVEYLDFLLNSNSQSINDWLQSRSELCFDLSKPLFDSVLVKVEEEKHIWYLNLHHIITDAASSVIIFDRMSRFYSELSDTNSISKDIEPLKYSDYVIYESNQAKLNTEDRIYWEDKVKYFPQKPMLYGEKHENITTSNSHRVVLNLDSKQSEQLRLISRNKDIRIWTEEFTLFTIFSTLFIAYLNRVSGEKKLIVGAPVHNRTTSKFKKTAGLFMEMFPITMEINKGETFYELLQNVKKETSIYLKHAVTGATSAEINRGFNIVFNYINSSFSNFAGFNSKTEWVHPNHHDPGHQLRCIVCDLDDTGNTQLIFDINDGVLTRKQSQCIPSHFSNIVDAFIQDINQPIEAPKLANISEIQDCLHPKITNDPYRNSVLENFENTVIHYPNEVALQIGDVVLTYSEVNKKSNRIAHFLRKKGAVENSKVTIYTYRSVEYILALLAVMKLRCAFIPIAADQPEERINYIISNSGSDLVLTETNLKRKLSNTNIPVLELQEVIQDSQIESAENLKLELFKNDLAYVLYTSGSTGNPKGVLISHGALSNYILWAKDYYKTDHTSVFPLFTSIGFDLTITSTILPLVIGGKIVIYKENPFAPDLGLLQLLGENIVNTIKLTPSHLTFLQGRDLSHSNIRKIIVGGEDFKVQLGKSILEAFGNNVKIYNEYGPTEATVGCIVSEFKLDTHQGNSIPIGKPISNMHAYILDAYKNFMPKGVIGELYLSGNSLADGYLQLSDLTSTKFIENPFVSGEKMYRTGDLARINREGDYEYFGRIDEQIKIKGHRVELTDIESNILNFEGVDNCAVLMRIVENDTSSNEVSDNTQQLIAYYTSEKPISTKDFRKNLVNKMPSYMVPDTFIHLDELPLTSNGKIDKKCLKENKYQKKEEIPNIDFLKLYGINPAKCITGKFNRISHSITSTHYSKLKDLSLHMAKDLKLSNSVALSHLFKTVYFAFLYRISRQTRLTIGTPFKNFPNNIKKGEVADYDKLGALTIELRENETFLSLTQRISQEMYSSTKMIQSDRGTNNTKGFDTVFSYTENTDVYNKKIKHQNSKYQLLVSIENTSDLNKIELNLDFNSGVFDIEKQREASLHFIKLLEACIENQSQTIHTVNLITEAEIVKINSWNNTSIEYPKWETLLTKFEAQVLNTPDKKALIFEERYISYKSLDEKSNQVARFLIDKGVKPNDIVAISIDRSIEMMIYIYGIIKSGAAYLPIDTSTPTNRLEFILNDAKTKFLFYNHDAIEANGSNEVEYLHVDVIEDRISLLSTSNNNINTAPEDLAYIIYTSGSTGQPKGVKCHHKGICNRLNWMNSDYPITLQDIFLQKTPITFDVSLWELFWPLQVGATLVIEIPDGHKNPDKLIQTIKKHQVTNIHFVPSMLNIFNQTQGIEGCISLKRIFCSGEALSIPIVDNTYAKLDHVEIHNLYGPTEASVDVTSWHCKRNESTDSIPIGKPVSNTQLYILDDALQMQPIGVTGELYIAGVQVANGYLNRTSLTQERFIKNIYSEKPEDLMYKTGDLARYSDDGVIEYHGRIDNQIKIRGLRIELGEIEKTLEQHHEIVQAVVIKHEEKDNLIAYYAGSNVPETEVLELLKNSLPLYMIPSAFVYVEKFEFLSSGKINRKELPKYEDVPNPKNLNEFVSPRNEFEELVEQIWSEVLEQNNIGVFDDFVGIGGHSLAAIRITSRIKEELELEIPLNKVFEFPTIASYANYIEKTILELL